MSARRARGVSRVAAILASMVVLGVAATALAEPIVVVHVRRQGTEIADAEVVVTDSSGGVGRCRTTSGTCEIRGLAPGRATVSARGERGEATPATPVMIPPDGKVSLIVAVP